MHIAQYYDCDLVNGEGCGPALFVSGCKHKCKGCYNHEAWDFKFGVEYTSKIEERILDDCKLEHNTRFSVLGGDPLMPGNFETVYNLLLKIKRIRPSMKIWLWTGWTLDQVIKHKKYRTILRLVDVLIDGKFEESLKDLTLEFRGSSNQNITCIEHLPIDSLLTKFEYDVVIMNNKKCSASEKWFEHNNNTSLNRISNKLNKNLIGRGFKQPIIYFPDMPETSLEQSNSLANEIDGSMKCVESAFINECIEISNDIKTGKDPLTKYKRRTTKNGDNI